MAEIAELTERLRAFAEARDWGQFHTPRNLTLALMGEVGELAELMQWRSDEQVRALRADRSTALADEVADVAIYLMRLSDVLEIDLAEAIVSKIDRNGERYPADLVRGRADKAVGRDDETR